MGFRVDESNGTIDIGGFFMSTSQKYRNVAHNAKVALVVDDVPSVDPWRVRCLEIRGTAEAIPPTHPAKPGDDDAVIRIHPSRVISFGLEDSGDPHEMLEKMRGRADPIGLEPRPPEQYARPRSYRSRRAANRSACCRPSCRYPSSFDDLRSVTEILDPILPTCP